MRRHAIGAIALTALALVGCGKDSKDAPPDAATSAELRAQLRGATQARTSDFPATNGRTLQQVADSLAGTGPQVAMATSVFVSGESRVAFGLIDAETGFVYGKTAVYYADRPGGRARGPFPAPADLLVTDAAYRSQTAAGEDDLFAAIYSAQVPLRSTGSKALLMVVENGGKLYGAGTRIRVVSDAKDKIPAPGEAAPKAATDTYSSAAGDMASIDTRRPFDDMHEVNAADAIGRKPVALLFATPQLCESRVCGPVVDIAAQLKTKYGDRVEFIHQEVYLDNNPSKGLRDPLKRFNLRTEPWLFVIDRNGKVAARLEGSFGFAAFERALESGLR